MAVEFPAEWRGEITQRVSDHDRRLVVVERDVDEAHGAIREVQDALLVHRARMSMFAALGGILGSGIGGAVVAAILTSSH